MTVATITQTASTFETEDPSVFSEIGTTMLLGGAVIALLQISKRALPQGVASMISKIQKGVMTGGCCIIAGQVAQLASSSTMSQVASSTITPLAFMVLAKRSISSFSIWHPLNSLKAVPYAAGLVCTMAVYASIYPISTIATGAATVILPKILSNILEASS